MLLDRDRFHVHQKRYGKPPSMLSHYRVKNILKSHVIFHAYYVLMQMRLHKFFDPILYHGRVSLVVCTQQVCFDETVLG